MPTKSISSPHLKAAMQGLMQQRSLLISSLLDHAATFHGATEIVAVLPEGTQHRTTWREIGLRAKQLANALAALGVRHGDRVATLAWNTHRHVELYFGVSGSGVENYYRAEEATQLDAGG